MWLWGSVMTKLLYFNTYPDATACVGIILAPEDAADEFSILVM